MATPKEYSDFIKEKLESIQNRISFRTVPGRSYAVVERTGKGDSNAWTLVKRDQSGTFHFQKIGDGEKMPVPADQIGIFDWEKWAE